jgi:hypothetical protein
MDAVNYKCNLIDLYEMIKNELYPYDSTVVKCHDHGLLPATNTTFTNVRSRDADFNTALAPDF